MRNLKFVVGTCIVAAGIIATAVTVAKRKDSTPTPHSVKPKPTTTHSSTVDTEPSPTDDSLPETEVVDTPSVNEEIDQALKDALNTSISDWAGTTQRRYKDLLMAYRISEMEYQLTVARIAKAERQGDEATIKALYWEAVA